MLKSSREVRLMIRARQVQMSAVCQRRKKECLRVLGTSWAEAEKGELQGDARVRVEAGDRFVEVFCSVGPRGG